MWKEFKQFDSHLRHRIGMLLVGSLVLFASGCANWRLPRIDPSGDRIFLPAPNTTTLESCLPKAAFTGPVDPPKCRDPFAPGGVVPASSSGPCAPGRNQLKLTPARIVAPVGTEVVLLAGYCGPDGYFVTKQPVEWMLTQDSVGSLMDMGKPEHEYLAALMQETPRKPSPDYIVNYTLANTHTITRGTPQPQDDVKVNKGQTWISVTSPTEGSSHITVMAPKAEGWDQRRQTATIHWIDAQWQLPQPAVVRAGQQQVLTTTVTRATNGSPLADWHVRYEVANGPAAAFANGQTSIELKTNEAGQAAVELVPQTNEGGTTNVLVEIVRPAMASGDLPRTVVGQGYAAVTWSAPSLALNVAGPDVMELDTAAAYRIELSNRGALAARDVVVTATLPSNLEFVSSDPPARDFTGRLEWQAGDLEPGTVRYITLNTRARNPGDVRLCVKARSADGLETEGCKERTRVFAPALSLEMSDPKVADVGGEVKWVVDITNRTDRPLTNVTITDRFDRGLSHVQEQTQVIRRILGTLPPGETQRLTLTFVAREPGQLCHNLEVTADGGHTAVARGCVTASPPPPGTVLPSNALQVLITGPNRAAVGEKMLYVISLRNTGPTPLTNLRVAFTCEDSLKMTQAQAGFTGASGELIWSINRLFRDETSPPSFKIEVVGLRPDAQAVTRVTVTTDENVTASHELATELIGDPNSPAANSPGSNPSAGGSSGFNDPVPTGNLSVWMTDTKDPVRSGENAEFLVEIKNDRNVSDRDVTMRIEVPEGVAARAIRTSGPSGAPRLSSDGRFIELSPVAELRAGESLRSYRIEVESPPPGKLQLRVQVRSQRTLVPIDAEAETSVLAQ